MVRFRPTQSDILPLDGRGEKTLFLEKKVSILVMRRKTWIEWDRPPSLEVRIYVPLFFSLEMYFLECIHLICVPFNSHPFCVVPLLTILVFCACVYMLVCICLCVYACVYMLVCICYTCVQVGEVLTPLHLNARVVIDGTPSTPSPLQGSADATGGADTSGTPSYASQLTQSLSYTYAYLEGGEGSCEVGHVFPTPGFLVLQANLEPLPHWLLTPCGEPMHEELIRGDNFEPSFEKMKIHVSLPPPPLSHQVTWATLPSLVYGTPFAEHHYDARLVPPLAGTLSYYLPNYTNEDDADPPYLLAHQATVDKTGKTTAR